VKEDIKKERLVECATMITKTETSGDDAGEEWSTLPSRQNGEKVKGGEKDPADPKALQGISTSPP